MSDLVARLRKLADLSPNLEAEQRDFILEAAVALERSEMNVSLEYSEMKREAAAAIQERDALKAEKEELLSGYHGRLKTELQAELNDARAEAAALREALRFYVDHEDGGDLALTTLTDRLAR